MSQSNNVIPGHMLGDYIKWIEKNSCPFGCILRHCEDGKTRLEGDCRMPESEKCFLRKRDKR